MKQRDSRFRGNDEGGDARFRPIAGISAHCHDLLMAQPPAKSDRMELRRAIGNREVAGPYAPPYHRGPDYLIAHACFDCRKSWKIEWREGAEPVCPHCGSALHEMGRNFKAPKKRDTEQWKKVQALWTAGVRFGEQNLAEPPPERLRDVDDYVRARKQRPS